MCDSTCKTRLSRDVNLTRLPNRIHPAMIPGMTNNAETDESRATALCKSCGLCCTGHLFVWTKLRSAELDGIQSLGVQVFREPGRRGFNQPCPLWDGQCTIYDSPQYPRFCYTYKCKLLLKVLNENIPFPDATGIVRDAMTMIRELETLLPESPLENFRERLIAYLESEDSDSELLSKAQALLSFYEEHFGVDDFFEEPGDGRSG
ncbi:MAG: hypothetical protein FIB03_05500 [Anaerolineae bacterium]|nr:hypothetical protein [Anaerolineae bacterium]